MNSSLFALGPLTNLAKAIRKDPTKMQRLRRIVMMGGAFEAYGNVTTTAEFNIFCRSTLPPMRFFQFGVPIHVVPLDCQRTKLFLTGERLHAEIENREDTVSCFLWDATQACMEFYRQRVGFLGSSYPTMHSLSVCSHNPEYFESVDANVQVETTGKLTNGMTVADLRPERRPRNPNAHVCIKVATEAFLDIFFKRLR